MQAFNDFLIFGSMAVSSFSSGQMLEYFGWQAINEVIFPTIFVAGAHAGVAQRCASGRRRRSKASERTSLGERAGDRRVDRAAEAYDASAPPS